MWSNMAAVILMSGMLRASAAEGTSRSNGIRDVVATSAGQLSPTTIASAVSTLITSTGSAPLNGILPTATTEPTSTPEAPTSHGGAELRVWLGFSIGLGVPCLIGLSYMIYHILKRCRRSNPNHPHHSSPNNIRRWPKKWSIGSSSRSIGELPVQEPLQELEAIPPELPTPAFSPRSGLSSIIPGIHELDPGLQPVSPYASTLSAQSGSRGSVDPRSPTGLRRPGNAGRKTRRKSGKFYIHH